MRSPRLLLSVAALATAVAVSPPDDFGWLIPENLLPAVYEWIFIPGRNGHETALSQFDIDPKVNFTSKRVKSRLPMPGTQLICSPFNDFNNASFNAAHSIVAMEMLANWCERYPPKLGGLAAAVFGRMSWYRCAYDLIYPVGPHKMCARDEIFEAERILDRKCGYGMPGEIMMRDWKMAYGRGIHGNSICRGLLDQPGH